MSERPNQLVSVAFTLAPAFAGVIFFNLVSWLIWVWPRYSGFGADDRFVLHLVLPLMMAAVTGALVGTYRFIRTGERRQLGIWVLLAASCLSADMPEQELNVFPLAIGIDVRLESAHLGVNFLGVALLLAYSWWVLPGGGGVSPSVAEADQPGRALDVRG